MNDFTKKELQIMLLDMNGYAKSHLPLKESPSHRALREKIQSMIDIYDAIKIDVWHCEKCGHVQ